MKPTLLTPDVLQQALTTLPGWQVEVGGQELVRTFEFKSYLDGIEFVKALGTAAEAMNHHPDMLVGWRKVTVRLSTHSAGGLTALDVELAGKASAMA
ncbi:MAG: 4a-hydroxytetrahydrobiopterin dehydratase [Prosthecobacter sp.]